MFAKKGLAQSVRPFLALRYTAFSLYYATACRFAGDDLSKKRKILEGITALGYVCSFGGFTTLVSYMYPLLGYLPMDGSPLKKRKKIINSKVVTVIIFWR